LFFFFFFFFFSFLVALEASLGSAANDNHGTGGSDAHDREYHHNYDDDVATDDDDDDDGPPSWATDGGHTVAASDDGSAWRTVGDTRSTARGLSAPHSAEPQPHSRSSGVGGVALPLGPLARGRGRGHTSASTSSARSATGASWSMPRQAPAHVAHADPPSSTAAAAWFDDAPGTDTDGGGLWEYEGDVGFVDAPSSRADNDGYSNSGGGGGGGAACASSGWASGETDTSDLVDRLVAMGFSHRDSERCLAECDGDIERAATVCQCPSVSQIITRHPPHASFSLRR
jgi:hypothetical protein